MVGPAISPFPYARWPRVARREVHWLRSALRALPHDGFRAARLSAEAMLGAPLRIVPGPPLCVPAAEARRELNASKVALHLERSSLGRTHPLLCDVSPALAAELVDRVLGGDGRPGQPVDASLDELSSGVLAYLAARTLAAGAAGELRLRGLVAGERASALIGSAGPEPEASVLVYPLAIELGGARRDDLRVFCPPAAIAALPTARRAPLRPSLRALPIRLCAHAATVTLGARELRALEPGDVVVPERCALVRTAHGFEGEVALHAAGSRSGFTCRASGRELVLVRRDDPGETAMTEGKRIRTEAMDMSEPAPEAPAGASTELCLELARFTLPLEQVCELRAGEVLCTGRAIGELVTLTANGRAIARGELVDVEGEIGMRITELL